jgi:hypothetical protein
MADVHVDDYGTVFIIPIVDQSGAIVDVSGATTKQIWFENPRGTVTLQTATFTTTGTDGKIQYTTAAGDLPIPGLWKMQGYVVLSGTQAYHTEWLEFAVVRNLR